MFFTFYSRKAVCLLLVLCILFSGYAFADISRQPYQTRMGEVLLRSDVFHNGSCKWQMIKHVESDLDGSKVSMRGFEASGTYDAIVPGTVLNTLVYNKVFPEPYYGLNNAREKGLIPDISEVGSDYYTYWFRCSFVLPNFMAGKKVVLECDGINYRAEFWLNGKKLGDMAGMFNRGFFDITNYLNFDSDNVVAILVRPVDVPGGFTNKYKEARAVGENKNGGDGQFGRNVSMLMSTGWDFTFSDGVRDRNTGIWKDIKIFAVDPVELRDPFVASSLQMPDMDLSKERVSVELVNHSSELQNASVKIEIPLAGIAIEKSVPLRPNETQEIVFTPSDYSELILKSPRLWWPVNKGPQNLYELKTSVLVDGKISDVRMTRFAIRDVRSDQNTPDKSRQFYVNGKPIFLHGTNWIPEAMLRKTEERMYAEMRYTAQSGINFIRFWAGGIPETEQFYDLCDELGIMVSMEYWLTGDTVLPDDTELYRANFADTIKTQRNHPCLVYYISANERGHDNIVPVKDLVDELDGTRQWQAASEVDGIHDGSPYKYVNPMFYYDDTASNRGSRINGLCPEYGTSCLPTLDCLKEMMDESDIWPVNKLVWDYHDGGAFHDMVSRYVPAIEKYGKIDSAKKLEWGGQAVGAVGYRSIWECWTYNRGNCGDRFTTGVWFWYHNSPIRQVCGRMWDWSLEPTAALYFSQDAHEPIHAQYDFIKNTVSLNNEFYKKFEGFVSIDVFNMDMTSKLKQKVSVSVGPDCLTNDIVTVKLPEDLSSVHFIKLTVTDIAWNKVSDTFYWRSTEKYKGKGSWTGPLYGGFEEIQSLPHVKLDSSCRKIRNWYEITLTNNSASLAFMSRVKLTERGNDKPVRPTFYSDNYVSLLPGESVVINVDFCEPVNDPVFILDGFNVVRSIVGVN